MNETQKWFYYDGKWYPLDTFNEIVPSDSNRIYEVLRVINGKALFLEDHFERFEKSLSELKIKSPAAQNQIETILTETISRNKISICNIRFEVILENSSLKIAAYIVPFSYPTEIQYAKGVKLTTYQIERKNPHIKQSNVNNAVRNSIKDILIHENAFEVLLVDHNGNITEGSRSNVFFVKNDILNSPPSANMLEGITRKKVLQIAKKLNVEVQDNEIASSKIGEFQACFITGTSPKILPVNQIGQLNFDINNKLMRQLMEEYNKLIDAY